MTKLMELATLQPKRPINTKKRGVRKKQRIKDLLNVPTCTPHRFVLFFCLCIFRKIILFAQCLSLHHVFYSIVLIKIFSGM